MACFAIQTYISPTPAICNIQITGVSIQNDNGTTHTVLVNVSFSNTSTTSILLNSQPFNLPSTSGIASFALTGQTNTGAISQLTVEVVGQAGCLNTFNYLTPIVQTCSIVVNSITPSICLSNNTHYVDVNVTYSNLVGANLQIQDVVFPVASQSGTEVFRLSGLACTGQSENIILKSTTDELCTTTASYNAPGTDCSVSILSVTTTTCTQTGKYNVIVEVDYINAVSNTITVNLLNEDYDFTIVNTTGTRNITIYNLDCVISPTNVLVSVDIGESCTDSTTYLAPQTALCSLSIDNIGIGSCVGGVYSLDVTVTYNNLPVATDILIDGIAYTPSSQTGTETFTLNNRACQGLTDLVIIAEVQGVTTCSDSVSYNEPNLSGDCFVNIIGLNPTICDNGTYSLQVIISYGNQPTGLMVISIGNSNTFVSVSGDGTDSFTISSLECLKADTQSVSVYFQNNPNCAAIKSFTTPSFPYSPVNLSINCSGDTPVLSWQNQGDTQGITLFIECSKNNGAWVVEDIITATGLNQSYTAVGISDYDGQYRYRINYLNVNSSIVSCVLMTNPVLSIDQSSNSQIDLSWTSNIDPSKPSLYEFEVQRAIDGISFTPYAILGGNATSFQDTGIIEGNTYTYKVIARYKTPISNSTPSNPVVSIIGEGVPGDVQVGVSFEKPICGLRICGVLNTLKRVIPPSGNISSLVSMSLSTEVNTVDAVYTNNHVLQISSVNSSFNVDEKGCIITDPDFFDIPGIINGKLPDGVYSISLSVTYLDNSSNTKAFVYNVCCFVVCDLGCETSAKVQQYLIARNLDSAVTLSTSYANLSEVASDCTNCDQVKSVFYYFLNILNN